MLHDATYKAAFSHPRMMRDQLSLVTQLVGDQLPILHRLRLDTLERLPSEYVTDNREKRFGDMVWRVALHPASPDEDATEPQWLHILLMLEFQSRPDWIMAVRVQSYAALLYLDLHKREQFKAGNPVPPVLPLVLYNGSEPWRAPLSFEELVHLPAADGVVTGQAETGEAARAGIQIGTLNLVGGGFVLIDQQGLLGYELPEDNAASLFAWIEGLSDPGGLARIERGCADWLSGTEDGSLLGVVLSWLDAASRQLEFSETEGSQMALVRLTESTLPAEGLPVELEDRVAYWRRKLLEEGKAEGREEGEARGDAKALVRERYLLRRQVVLRFGEDTAERFGALLEDVSDPDRLAEMGEWIIECEDGASLIARVGG